jgi:CRISPR system Cascade subunit CasA
LTLNLINEPWIPVIDKEGIRRTIAPWEMTDPSFVRPDWPRADLNIACLELLIGLVFMADPPKDIDDWEDRSQPDQDRLRERLAAYAPAFNLLGEGPRFLQDLDPFSGVALSLDALFVDSAGAKTAKDNADLMTHRNRYNSLDLPLASIALYAFQAHAPSGGAGNRTSMRGGGPLVTLIDPGDGLWSLVWANVPYGKASKINQLPWMRPTNLSDKSPPMETFPPNGQQFSVEAFFGMPRRLRLISGDSEVTGVIQKPHGTKYAVWKHPLTPYYQTKPGEVALPVHPRAGHFGYRHWRGTIVATADADLTSRASCVDTYETRTDGVARIIVAGWAMENMKPLDFIHSTQPFIKNSEEKIIILSGMIVAADSAALALRSSLKPVLSEGESREAEREGFFITTETSLQLRLAELQSGADFSQVCKQWLKNLEVEALRRFDAIALNGLDQCDVNHIQKIVGSRRNLTGTFAGYGKIGTQIFTALMLDIPKTKGH